MSTTPALLLVVKVSLVLLAALVAAWMARRAPARVRHLLWSGAFAAVLLLPLLAATVPALRVPVPAWRAARVEPAPPASANRAADVAAVSASEASQATPLQPAQAPDGRAVSDIATAPRVSFPALLTGAWMFGAAAAVAALLLALARVVRLTRSATELTDDGWQEAASTLAARLGLRARVRLLLSPLVSTPMAGGLITPTIFLPATAREWTADLRDVVLAHEIAHLAGRDPLRHVLTRLAVAAYWFHPLAWIAARHSAVAREQACDEAVIALGTRPSLYARVLLDFADAAAPRAAGVAALPIVQRTLLEKRLMAILNDDARSSTRRVALIPAALAALTLSVAAAQPSQVESTRDGLAQAIAPGVSESRSQFPISNLPGGVPGGIPGGVPAGVPGGIPDGVPGGVPGVLPGGVPGGVSGGIPGAAFMINADQSGRSACDWRGSGSFNGMTDMSRRDGRDFIHERVGRQGYDLVIQKTFDTLRVCAFAQGLSNDNDFPRPGTWTSQSRHVVLETQEPNLTRRMEIEGGTMSYSVNGQQRPIDDSSREWADRLTELLDAVWELRMLRGQESSLRGQISSIQGQRSSLQGQISSLRGRVSSMQGEISSWQGRESSMRGEISSIQGQLSSMQGQISSEQGAISSLQSRRWDASDAERARIADQIDRHRARIKEIEKQIAQFDVHARVREVEKRIEQAKIDENIAEVEKRLRAFDVEKRVDEVEKAIVQLEVEKRVREFEREVDALDVERRARDLERRVDAALKRLREVK